MADQRLTSIEVEGFTSIRSTRLELGAMNVLIGANGAGKSNFIQAVGMLSRIVGGELNFFVGLNGGSSALLNNTSGWPRIHLELDAYPHTYEATLVPAAGNELIFELEAVSFISTEGGSRREVLGRGHQETKLNSHEAAVRITELLNGCKVFHFHDTSLNAPPKRQVSVADNISLRADAGNLAAVLLGLQTSRSRADRAAYRRIVGAIKLVAPFFRDFVLHPASGTDHVQLRWLEKNGDAVFSANQLSDGTLRFVCLATLLLQPALPTLVVLDEPELGLHPFAIVQLADMLRQASARSQVLIATQSVTLMNQFEVEDLVIVERAAGASVFTRPDPERLKNWLDEYSLGELWEKNLIGGQPGSTGSVLDD
ncbi:AAA family ATPase [Amycolatopsis sp. H20-H5]|uniref:AAA family ATPase n=1 Tax=Amycolatopsis sp. H20-H5 TaxID=3046309 RepID=UPI002DBE5ED7|nr:AAA family ATPase [Amycolatopsis sp. H20-H5]MEC3981073.1 AAA family ATPase [Amycolatopsis sp. H20-H5]